jgi:LPXTG-motif cell wall-anchored protein
MRDVLTATGTTRPLATSAFAPTTAYTGSASIQQTEAAEETPWLLYAGVAAVVGVGGYLIYKKTRKGAR